MRHLPIARSPPKTLLWFQQHSSDSPFLRQASRRHQPRLRFEAKLPPITPVVKCNSFLQAPNPDARTTKATKSPRHDDEGFRAVVKLVGVIGFEPTASCTPCRRATGLRHTPTETPTLAQQTRALQCSPIRPSPTSRCYNSLLVEPPRFHH
jgi:hypothetical protein